jgi:hypothetical protein
MVNREAHGSQRLRRIISGRFLRLAGGRAPGAEDMARSFYIWSLPNDAEFN